MATKPAAKNTRTTTQPKDTSAPAAPETRAEVSAQGEASASPAAAPQPPVESANPVVTTEESSPAGGEPIAKALIVVAHAEGFRRAGRAWTIAQQTVPIDEFTQDQVEALLAEPMLEVVVVAE